MIHRLEWRIVRAVAHTGVLVSLYLGLGCVQEPRGAPSEEAWPESVVNAPVGHFTDVFTLADSLTLEQPPDQPLVRISGLDVNSEGTIAIADASEGNVKLYARDGHLVSVIGRKGEGPGEFSQPRFPRFTKEDQLIVGDAQLGRVTWFDKEGGYVRSINLGLVPIMGFQLTHDGFLVSGVSGDSTGDSFAVARIDTTGAVLSRHIPVRLIGPSASPEYPGWRSLTQYWVAASGDTARIVSTLTNRLVSLHLPSGSVQVSQVNVPEYVPPSPPDGGPSMTVKDLVSWQRGFHIAATVLASPELLLVPFVKGVLNYGDPMLLAARTSDGRWRTLTGAPPPVLVTGDSVFTILHPEDHSNVTLGVYRVQR